MSFNPIALNGKRFLISGAASGLGRATSILLSKLGAELVLLDINEEGLNSTKELCGDVLVHCIIANLQNPVEIKPVIIGAVEKWGKLNGFVHLAGRAYVSPLKSINHNTSTEIFNLNTYAAIEMAKVFTNKNVYAGVAGSIIFISSVYGFVGSAANVGYAMSKAALHGVTKSLSIELASKNIRVNCVAPGFIKTKMLDNVSGSFNEDYFNTLNNLHPLGLGEADDVANAIAFLLSDMSKWITGTILSVDGGFTAQ
jgi:NAD(P)-dependent dehydrogenase (short-subunit alcohol dehydrogenase family)